MLVPVYDIKNCGPRHRFSANGRLVHNSDKINLQNLPSRGINGGKLKKAIKAPEGYSIIDADSAQIEARVLAWLAGQEDLVEAFAKKEDVYKKMAASIYGKPEADITKPERFVGKTTILGCGYGMGAAKFQAALKSSTPSTEISIEEARRIIDIYRKTSPEITRLWTQAQRMLVALSQGDGAVLGRDGVLEVVPKETGIKLPNGLFLRYDDLQAHQGAKGYEFTYKTRKGRIKIYGGKCLAANTEVLTQRGWVPIVRVSLNDKVWDGIEWVKHGGLTYQGEKPTIVLNGISMTPDHQVLTEGGWKDASSCEGLRGAKFWMPDGGQVCGSQRAQVDVGVQMHVWDNSQPCSHRCGEVCQTGGQPIMRLRGRGENQNPRYEQTSSVLGMALDARPMSSSFPPSVAQLRSAWGSGMRYLGQFIRSILERHGQYVSGWAYVGSQGQQRELRVKQLPVGFDAGTSGESSGGTPSGYSQSQTTDGYFHINTSVSVAPRAVYDILNAGHRSRFVVRGSTGPFIVHNCVENLCQAIARCIIGEQMLRIAKRYKVVLTVHDAVACVVRDEEVEVAQAYVEECMRWVPEWAAGLPLNCESGFGKSYGDC